MSERFQSFEEFWPFYLSEHSKRATRWFHVAGTLTGTAIALGSIVTLNPLGLALALLAGYGPAWFSHFFIEHNKPASWKHPLWSFMGDWKMLLLTLTGKLEAPDSSSAV